MSTSSRVVFFGDGILGSKVVRYLRDDPNSELVGVVLHPPNRRNHPDELDSAIPDGTPRLVGDTLRQPASVETLASWRPDIAVSAFFAFILKPPVLSLFERGVVNIHPGYLPHGRGMDSQLWSIVTGEPTGATLHFIDEGIDTGPIIEQRRVTVEPTDTQATLRGRIDAEFCFRLFADNWPSVLRGDCELTPQDPTAGTIYRLRDKERIREIDLDATYTGRELIDRLRAFTHVPEQAPFFRDEPAAFFRAGGRKVYVSVALAYEDE